MRVVVKLGTSSLTDERGDIDQATIDAVAGQIATLRATGNTVVLVTSGAIAAGLPRLGLDAEDRAGADAVTLQAASAVGHPILHRQWDSALGEHGLFAGQILLAPHNFGDRNQYLHAKATLDRLLDLEVIPLINENDAVTDTEIRYGDNDRIAALAAHLVDADLLVLLTDIDGVLTADPRIDPNASLVSEIVEIDAEVTAMAGGAGTNRGSGGMASKLAAARIAAWSGVRTVIARADRPDVLVNAVVGGDDIGTTVHPRPDRLSARKLWIGFAMAPVGAITIDAGAVSALEAGGRSLLAAGVSHVDGSFETRDAVEITGPDGTLVAKGIARMSSERLGSMAGSSTKDLDPGQRPVVVHADDLVLLG